MKLTASRIHSEYVIDLLKQLKNINIGTNNVMNAMKKLFHNGKISSKAVRCIMNEKLVQAHKELQNKKCIETGYWRRVKPMFLRESIYEEFEEEWRSERTRKRVLYKERRKSKVLWMKKKYRSQIKEIPECWNNVIIRDQLLDEEFDRECKAYGGVIVNEDEKSVLSMNPKYTVFDKINPINCEAECEKALTKIRWKYREEKRAESREYSEPSTVCKDDAFNFELEVFDFRDAISTNLPFNVKTSMPEKLKLDKEIKLQELKMKLKNVTETYARKNRTEHINMGENIKRGLKSLIERRDSNEIVVFQTDKSGKMSVDTKENYIMASATHFQDKEIELKEARTVETEINAHAVFWIKMLQAGKSNNDEKRYTSSIR